MHYLVSMLNGKEDDITGVSRVDYTDNWVVFYMEDGSVLRINASQILTILFYEE